MLHHFSCASKKILAYKQQRHLLQLKFLSILEIQMMQFFATLYHEACMQYTPDWCWATVTLA